MVKNWLDLRNDLSLSCVLISWRVCQYNSDSIIAGCSTAEKVFAEHGTFGSYKLMNLANSGYSSIV